MKKRGVERRFGGALSHFSMLFLLISRQSTALPPLFFMNEFECWMPDCQIDTVDMRSTQFELGMP